MMRKDKAFILLMQELMTLLKYRKNSMTLLKLRWLKMPGQCKHRTPLRGKGTMKRAWTTFDANHVKKHS
jgi:hypothetical protein